MKQSTPDTAIRLSAATSSFSSPSSSLFPQVDCSLNAAALKTIYADSCFHSRASVAAVTVAASVTVTVASSPLASLLCLISRGYVGAALSVWWWPRPQKGLATAPGAPCDDTCSLRT